MDLDLSRGSPHLFTPTATNRLLLGKHQRDTSTIRRRERVIFQRVKTAWVRGVPRDSSEIQTARPVLHALDSAIRLRRRLRAVVMPGPI